MVRLSKSSVNKVRLSKSSVNKYVALCCRLEYLSGRISHMSVTGDKHKYPALFAAYMEEYQGHLSSVRETAAAFGLALPDVAVDA